jgi:hypothetical protein
MPGQETDHLPGHLQVWHPAIEIDPVKTLQIQTHMPIQDIVHRHHTGCHGLPPGRKHPNPATLASRHCHVIHQPSNQPRRSEATAIP